MANKEKLFTEFTAPTTQEWLDKIQVDLKGADFQKRLVWRTNEGFNVQPFYRREDLANLKTPDALPGEFPFVRGNKKDNNEWYVRQNIAVEDPKEANAKALDILNKGIDSLGFRIKGSDVSAEFIETLLKDIYCEIVDLNFRSLGCLQKIDTARNRRSACHIRLAVECRIVEAVQQVAAHLQLLLKFGICSL